MKFRQQVQEAITIYRGRPVSAAVDIYEPIVRELIATIEEMVETGGFMTERQKRLAEIKEML